MKRFLVKWFRRFALSLLAFAGVVAVFLILTPQGRAGYHTAFFVLQVLDLGIRPQTWFTPEPVREEVTYPQASGEGVADIYRVPANAGQAAVLIFLGANAAGRDDKDVVNLGESLARAGFVTMFHWSPTMALRHNIDPGEVDNLVHAFLYLRSREFVDQERVGMGGFCVGASFALVAASDPRIRDDVVFVNAFGPYFDARDLLVQVASRSSFYEDAREPWEPDRLTMLVLGNELIETVEDPPAKETLSRHYLVGRTGEPGSLDHLPSDAQIVRRIMDGAAFSEAEDLYRALPETFRVDLQTISPSARVQDLRAKVMLMHTQGDRLIPVAESRRMADWLETRGDYRYTEVLAFDHVRPDNTGDLWFIGKEAFKLYRHMYGIIREAV